jgi:type I restriction enzyme R subunit
VDQALRRVLSEHNWTGAQEQWLRRIAKQIQKNTVVDRKALDEPPFEQKGGFNRLNKVFDGQLTDVLTEIHEGIWDDEVAA